MNVFVYGTLMRGQPQGGLLKRFRREQAYTHGRLWRMPQGYPALERVGRGKVHGEWVRDVEERVLPLLDRYEGVSEGLYRRVEVDVIVGLRTFGAWAYVMDDPESRGGHLIEAGRWRGVIRR